MADTTTANAPNYKAYSVSNIPVIGGLVDYITTSIQYMNKSCTQAARIHEKKTQTALSTAFMCCTCLLLGLVCNVKFEVVTISNEPLANDLHLVLTSETDNLYIDDIDVSKVMLCLEASDALVIFISTVLIWSSKYSRTSLKEYLFLPWLGAVLRGVFTRQAPTAGALLYTMAVINGKLNPLFVSTFCFLLILEARLWLEVARVVRMRWEKRCNMSGIQIQEVETLWSKEDVPSVEVGNILY